MVRLSLQFLWWSHWWSAGFWLSFLLLSVLRNCVCLRANIQWEDPHHDREWTWTRGHSSGHARHIQIHWWCKHHKHCRAWHSLYFLSSLLSLSFSGVKHKELEFHVTVSYLEIYMEVNNSVLSPNILHITYYADRGSVTFLVLQEET